MKKTEKIWLDGKLVKWDDAKVHVLAHGLNYGTGVFEGIRVYETGKGLSIFRLKDHVRRLINGCKVMAIPLEFGGRKYGYDEIFEAIKEVARVNKGVDYVKPCVFLRGENVGLNPVNVPASMAITGVHMGAYLGEVGAGASLITSSWHRPDNLCSPAGAKVNGAYVTSCLAKREAVEQGADEAVMLNSNGYVAECTGENIFFYRNGKILTPKPSNSILEGITRNSVMEVARDMGYEVVETDVSRVEMLTSDEVWMTGTAAEVVSVTSIDRRPVGNGKPGPVTTALHDRFADIVRGKNPKYEAWLDYV
ncbi:MAG: branched-chain amino acid transaminase [Thermoplasmatales archaeon]|nr:branched-chain amino acid transaminase [Thermoplasmatales archaeon]